MGRLKRKSKAVEKARKRLAGMKAIDPALDLGNGLTVASVETQIDSAESALDDYNQELAVSDEGLNSVQEIEKNLDTTSANILSATKLKYGNNSSEYEEVGGTRASERKRPVRKPRNAA
jgi:hypothetical protein